MTRRGSFVLVRSASVGETHGQWALRHGVPRGFYFDIGNYIIIWETKACRKLRRHLYRGVEMEQTAPTLPKDGSRQSDDHCQSG
jgi:hypothetical protein